MSEHVVRHRGRKATAATLIAAAALGLAACNDTESDAAEAPKADGAHTARANTASDRRGPAPLGVAPMGSDRTGSHQAGSGESGGASTAPGRCITADLKAGWGSRGGGVPDMASGEQQTAAVWLKNTGDSSCTISGFPGVRIKGAGDRSVDLPRSAKEPVTVTLKPGRNASFTIRLAASQSDEDRTIEPGQVLITPPNEKRHFRLRWPYGGAILDQSAATQPGTFVDPVDVS